MVVVYLLHVVPAMCNEIAHIHVRVHVYGRLHGFLCTYTVTPVQFSKLSWFAPGIPVLLGLFRDVVLVQGELR